MKKVGEQIMLDERFLHGKEVIEKLEHHGYRAYFVGGAVRDLLLNKPIQDIDIATSALPEIVMSLFEKVIPVGIQHGTVIVRHRKKSFEVTTFRLDGMYSDARHPDKVEFINDIELDLKRRDFTINALAMNQQGEMIDLFGGQTDLKHRLIRTVGNQEKRFKEDPLRIIRALRFSSQLGFSIEHDTLRAMKKLKTSIKGLAIERITNELTKLIAGSDIKKGIAYLLDTGVHHYLPLFAQHPSLLTKLPNHLLPMQTFGEFIAMLHYLEPGISIAEWIKQWKCSNKTKNIATTLVNSLSYYETKGADEWLVYHLNTETYQGFINLVEMLSENQPLNKERLYYLIQTLPIASKSDLAIDGTTLIQMFPEHKKGPWINQILTQLEKMVVMKELPNKQDTLKEWVKCNPPEISSSNY